ncbi:MAG: glycosyltransferase family 2 protein [Planctomycetia bacterium]|nr:glycosyltransferase family 2 protein [Planctomycetia bacterium]
MISLVIPARNEEESLGELYRQITEVSRTNDYEMEMIFVDDGSSDGTWREMERLAADDPRVRAIRFRRNFGKAAALNVGFSEAEGDFVITLDADLQDDPHEIPNLLAKLDETCPDGRKYDVVSGWKKHRNDPRFLKVIPSRIFNGMVGWLTGVKLHDHNCGMKAYRAMVVREIRMYGEMHRFIPVLAASRGFRVTEIPVRHHARKHGVSKYGFTRFARGFLDLLTVKFSTTWGERPLHLFGTIGGISGLLGLVCLICSVWLPPGSRWNQVLIGGGIGLFLTCVQCVLAGLGMELRIFQNSPQRAVFAVMERTDRPSSSSETSVKQRGRNDDANV